MSRLTTTAAYDDIPLVTTRRDSFSTALVKGDCVCPGGLTLIARGAYIFAWGAKNYPNQWGPWTHIYKTMHGTPKLPTSGQRDVLLLRNKGSDIRKHLVRTYGLQFLTALGTCGRATFSDEDCADTALRRETDRLQRAHRAFAVTYDLINPTNIKNSSLRQWVLEGATKARALTGKIQSPPSEDEKDKAEEK